MTEKRLANTIGSFPNLNAIPLRREFRRRWRVRVRAVIALMKDEEKFRAKTENEIVLNRQAAKARRVLEKYLSLKL
jgi:hypothetical protein